MRACLSVAVGVAILSGCGSMYRDPPETMKKPPRTAVPIDDGEPAAPLPMVDACASNVHKSPTGVKRAPAVADAAVQRAHTVLAPARQQTDPKVRTSDYLRGLGEYRTALVADPYHADATLEMAVAYDELRYKGCALLLLGRIGEMQSNSLYATDANRVADAVRSTTGWFASYRNEALKAVNR